MCFLRGSGCCRFYRVFCYSRICACQKNVLLALVNLGLQASTVVEFAVAVVGMRVKVCMWVCVYACAYEGLGRQVGR